MTAWPTELKLDKDKRTLIVSFDDGASYDLPAEVLRVLSPSAEVQGHSPEQRITVPGKKNVRISRLEPVGNYAVRLVFDDGHDSGLYSFQELFRLGSRRDELWQAYLDKLSAAGVQRAQGR